MLPKEGNDIDHNDNQLTDRIVYYSKMVCLEMSVINQISFVLFFSDAA